MIHSLFLINSSGDIFLEKHWKSVISRSVCDYFFEAQERASEAENVPPVISTPHHYLLSIYRHKIFFVAVIQTEVPPLFVIEFLHRVVDTFQDSEADNQIQMNRVGKDPTFKNMACQ
uniref:Adaptor related protein complex 3 subunit mu 2 n=1 Tax=Naja naja TaxID=35670 RepID=A0A8C6X3S9_NAJNA